MTGQMMYNLHREYCAALNESIPAWEALDSAAQTQWEIHAYEQRLRDRPDPATLLAERKDVSYDGSYSD